VLRTDLGPGDEEFPVGLDEIQQFIAIHKPLLNVVFQQFPLDDCRVKINCQGFHKGPPLCNQYAKVRK
jgi:hypothetical protein